MALTCGPVCALSCPPGPAFPIRTCTQRPGCSRMTASCPAPALTVPTHQSHALDSLLRNPRQGWDLAGTQ